LNAIEELKHEHKIVLLVLDGVLKEIELIKETRTVNVDKIMRVIDFLKNFTDKCHHSKEEDHLFQRMIDRGMTGTNGPISVMLAEHTEGRRLVKSIEDALPEAEKDPKAVESIQQDLGSYVVLLKAHIDKEDNILYPLAEELLTDQDMKELEEAFEKIELEEMGEGEHEKYHQLAHELQE
jgi:hemerythrin-like domain-containing protein